MTTFKETTIIISASLYVGDLHEDVTEALLFDLFKEVGSIISIRICRDAMTRESLGYADVKFSNTQDAGRMYTVINDKMKIMWSQRDPSLMKIGERTIVIKNLEYNIDHIALKDTFSPLAVGYIHFATIESAEKSIEKVNGMLLNGKLVTVMHLKQGKGKSISVNKDVMNAERVNMRKIKPGTLWNRVLKKFEEIHKIELRALGEMCREEEEHYKSKNELIEKLKKDLSISKKNEKIALSKLDDLKMEYTCRISKVEEETKNKLREYEKREEKLIRNGVLPSEKDLFAMDKGQIREMLKKRRDECTLLEKVFDKKLENETTCSICMDKKKDTFLFPCGHSFCKDDAIRAQASGKCFICRKEVNGITKVF